MCFARQTCSLKAFETGLGRPPVQASECLCSKKRTEINETTLKLNVPLRFKFVHLNVAFPALSGVLPARVVLYRTCLLVRFLSLASTDGSLCSHAIANRPSASDSTQDEDARRLGHFCAAWPQCLTIKLSRLPMSCNAHASPKVVNRRTQQASALS